MRELLPDAFAAVRPLFGDIAHRHALVGSVFEGNHVGRVFVDDLTQPASVLIATACGLALLHGNRAGGAFHREALEALFGTLAVDEYAFVIALSDAWRPVLQSAPEPRGARWAYRVELGVDIAWFRAQGPCREGVSDGYTFRRYDGALAGLGREGGVRGPPRGARGGREDRQKASFDVPIQRRVSHARPAP